MAVSLAGQCSLCYKNPEMVDHLLASCEFAQGVREWICKWCGL